MKIVKSPKVYCCCGKYYATNQQSKDVEVKCISCGKTLNAPVKVPYIYIVNN